MHVHDNSCRFLTEQDGGLSSEKFQLDLLFVTERRILHDGPDTPLTMIRGHDVPQNTEWFELTCCIYFNNSQAQRSKITNKHSRNVATLSMTVSRALVRPWWGLLTDQANSNLSVVKNSSFCTSHNGDCGYVTMRANYKVSWQSAPI